LNNRSAKKADPRELPTYNLSEAAHYLRLPESTVRSWSLGGTYRTLDGEEKRAKPIFQINQRRPPYLSFFNLVEAYVLASIRRKHKVPMQKVRLALDFVKRELSVARPLIEQDFLTNGVDLFVEDYSRRLVNVSKQGQLALRDLLIDSLKRIDRDPEGLAVLLSPWVIKPDEPHYLEIDPFRSFGRSVIAGTNIPTEIIAERFRGGDSLSHLAEDYSVEIEPLEMAIRWEHRAKAA